MTQGPTTLGELRQGHDPRVPGLLAELEGMRSHVGSALGLAQRALGIVEGLAARIEHDEQLIEGLQGELEQLRQRPGAAVVDEHGQQLPQLHEVVAQLGELEGRQNALAKTVVQVVPGAADALRKAAAARG